MDSQTAETLLDLAEATSPGLIGLEAKVALGRLEERYADLLAALGWFIDRGRTDEAMRLAASLATFWRVTKRLSDGFAWCERTLASPGGDDAHRARASHEAGMLAFWMGDDGRASALFHRSVEMGHRLGEPTIIALAWCGLARIALRSDVGEARRLCLEALTVVDGTTDRLGRSSAIHVLGVAAQMAGDLLEARRLMTERIALARELGSYAALSMEASNLSMVERQLGDLERADVLAREALDIFHRREDHWAIPYGLNSVAAVARDRGEFERAATLIGAAEAMMEAQGAAWPPDERPHYEETLAAAAEAVGPAEFERARAVGRAMSTSAAVDFALQAGSPSKADQQ